MKKYLWVLALALVISALSAGSVAADSSHKLQDQAFLNALAQQVKAPVSPVFVLSDNPLPGPPAVCSFCTTDTDCWATCPGGEGSSYCDRIRHKCLPF
jgi:hypothetical protein